MATFMRYAAAGIKARFADWKSGQTSIDYDLRQDLRSLRDRSRALRQDNAVAKRYFNLRADNIVGSEGFSLWVSPKIAQTGEIDQTTSTAVIEAWKQFCKDPTVSGNMTMKEALTMVDASRACDGDVFIELLYGKEYDDNFKFAIHEADIVDETYNGESRDGNRIKMGVEIDPYGTPVAYYMFTQHPGDYDIVWKNRRLRRVTADKIIHFYKKLRPGQTRGEPELCSVMIYLKMLDGYLDAELTGRRLKAAISVFLEKETINSGGIVNLADEGKGTEEEPFIKSIEPGMMIDLPIGVKAHTFDPSGNAGDLSMFIKTVGRIVASGLGVSYNTLFCDLEGVNYSSIRAGTLDDRERWKTEQNGLIDSVLFKLFSVWLTTKVSFSNKPIINENKVMKVINNSGFQGRRWSWVDPEKDVAAAEKELALCLNTRSRICRTNGIEFANLVAEQGEDVKLMKKEGVYNDPQADKNTGDGKPVSDGGNQSGKS